MNDKIYHQISFIQNYKFLFKTFFVGYLSVHKTERKPEHLFELTVNNVNQFNIDRRREKVYARVGE